MSLIFKEEGHLYESNNGDNIDWVSVTSLVGKFKPKFDPIAVSERVSKSKKSKWYGLKPEEIREIWQNESKRATDLGTFYHNQREKDLTECNTLTVEDVELPIVSPIIKEGIKYAPDQKLTEGVYPEHFTYLKSAGICGQADYVDVVNGKVNILDYKTNKEIKTRGYKNWEGVFEKMEAPMNHLENCSLQHYTLQMSLYMYMILKHNRKLKPGKLTIQHVVFENEGEDKYGYPITKYNENGDPVIKDIVTYDVPYMKEEVITMINWLKENR